MGKVLPRPTPRRQLLPQGERVRTPPPVRGALRRYRTGQASPTGGTHEQKYASTALRCSLSEGSGGWVSHNAMAPGGGAEQMQADGTVEGRTDDRTRINQQNGGTRLISISARPLHAPYQTARRPLGLLPASLHSRSRGFAPEGSGPPPRGQGRHMMYV